MILLNKIKEKLKRFYHLHILKKRYYRLGKCAQCGCCCENIYVRHQGAVIQTQEEFDNIKATDNYSFYKHISIVNKDDFGLVFSCDKFDKTRRLCTEHNNRPSICKNYPSEEIFSFGAQLQEKCGYSFIPIVSFEEVFNKIRRK